MFFCLFCFFVCFVFCFFDNVNLIIEPAKVTVFLNKTVEDELRLCVLPTCSDTHDVAS